METKKDVRLDEKKLAFAGVRVDGAFILSCVVCLLPMILSLAVYNKLPEKVVMQWNFVGQPNWYAHKAVLAFGMPLFLLAGHIITNIAISLDPKRRNAAKALRMFIVWVIPCISLVIMPIALFMNMGVELPLARIIFTVVGVVLIFVGNYLPKTKQNHTVGVKTPWALKDADNWNRTHRFAGILFIVGGILFIIAGFLPLENAVGIAVTFSILLLVAFVPFIYSYCLYKKAGRLSDRWSGQEKS